MTDTTLPTVLHVDFDGTITEPPEDDDFDKYSEEQIHTTPLNGRMRDRLRSLTEQGHVVIVWTARPWGHATSVAGYLTRHEVPFEGLKMEKGGGGVYVDNNAVSPRAFLKNR